MDLISVIIPVYNHRSFFKQVIKSVLAQTYKNIEIIVVDDGSDKNIEEEIRNMKLEMGDRKINFFRFESNRGAPAARNKGLEMARGEYVIFWDADLHGYKNMLEEMHSALQKNSQASYAYCSFILGRVLFKGKPFDADELKKNNFIHSSSLIRKKDAVKWDESLKRFQDWDLWLTMLTQGKTGIFVDKFLYNLFPGGSMSHWLPSFAYKKPWRYLPWIRNRVKEYEETKSVVLRKHGLQ